jgi:hypothetical protein
MGQCKRIKVLGYRADEYVGSFIGDFHLDPMVVEDILGKLSQFETVSHYPAQMRAKDGSIRYEMINSNAYQQVNGEFGHSRCFTTAINKKIWSALTA